ncbi:MAG: hypothetical protein ACLS6O_03105 [Bifidobacterium sp.]
MNSEGVVTSFMGGSASEQGYYVDNGKVKSYYTSDALKDVVSYLHGLMARALSRRMCSPATPRNTLRRPSVTARPR